MKVSDLVRGHVKLEMTEHGIMCDCKVSGTDIGRMLVFDAFLKSMKMYNPFDQMKMMAIISAGGLEKLLGDAANVTVVDMSKLEEMMKDGDRNET